MRRQKKFNDQMIQLNVTLPASWKKQLENLARIYSVDEGKTITVLDLIRQGLQEKYQLTCDIIDDDNE